MRRGGRAVPVALLCLAACSPGTLQQQINAASEGARLMVPEGAHHGLVLRRAITLVGRGDATQLLDVTLGHPGVELRLESLSLPTGLDVPADASVTLIKISVGCSEPAASGLRVEGGLTARDVVTASACGWGVDVKGGSAAFSGGRLAGHRGGVRVVEGELSATDTVIEASHVQGAAVFGARSEVRLAGVTLSGGEQGLLMREGTLTAVGLQLRSSSQAGIALVGTRARLAQVEAQGPFLLAAIQVSEAPSVEVTALTVRDAGSTGVLALRSTILLSEVAVSGARADADGDFGHAVTLQDTRANLRGLYAADVFGAALYASDSSVQVRGLQARALASALVAIRSEVDLHGLRADALSGPAVQASESARVKLRETELPASSSPAVCVDAVVRDFRGTDLCLP